MPRHTRNLAQRLEPRQMGHCRNKEPRRQHRGKGHLPGANRPAHRSRERTQRATRPHRKRTHPRNPLSPSVIQPNHPSQHHPNHKYTLLPRSRIRPQTQPIQPHRRPTHPRARHRPRGNRTIRTVSQILRRVVIIVHQQTARIHAKTPENDQKQRPLHPSLVRRQIPRQRIPGHRKQVRQPNQL